MVLKKDSLSLSIFNNKSLFLFFDHLGLYFWIFALAPNDEKILFGSIIPPKNSDSRKIPSTRKALP